MIGFKCGFSDMRIILIIILFFLLISVTACEIPSTKLVDISEFKDFLSISAADNGPIKAWSLAQYNGSTEIDTSSVIFTGYTPLRKKFLSDSRNGTKNGGKKLNYVPVGTNGTYKQYYIKVTDYYYDGNLTQEDVFIMYCRHIWAGDDFSFRPVDKDATNFSGNATVYTLV